MFGVPGGPCHAASTADAAVGHMPTSSNLLASIHHNHQLLESVGQQLGDVPQQSGLACTATPTWPVGTGGRRGGV